MRRSIVAAALLLVACSQGTGSPVANVASPSASSSPASASPTASPAGLPVVHPAFSCRLPVYSYVGGVVQDAFISFPSGAVTPDAAGKQGMYYDRRYSRWLPVLRQAVSADGAHYAYVDQPVGDVVTFHVVDVATRKDHAFKKSVSALGLTGVPGVFDYGKTGIYFIEGFEHVFPGVWVLNPSTGAVVKVASLELPEVSSGAGVFWYGRINSGDPSPVDSRSSAGILPNEVDRYVVASKVSEQWLYRPGSALEVLGVDLVGHPVIRALVPNLQAGKGDGDHFYLHERSELVLGLGPTSNSSLYSGQTVESLYGMIADSHGLWFGGSDGIYLYSASGGMQKVSDHAGTPANGCF